MVKAKNGYASEEEEVEEVSQNGEEEEEEEYEIEAILDAKQGTFEGGKLGYLVKWKGYAEEHNSWVSEEDASNAQDLIQAYWSRVEKKNTKKPAAPRKSEPKTSVTSSVSKKRTSPEETESVSAPPKKRGRPPKAKPVSESEDDEPVKLASVKKGRKSAISRDEDAMDEDVVEEEPYADMKKWINTPSWEHLVHHIDTVERTEDGKLYVYFQLNKKHGDKMCREETSVCREKMPKMLFDFYEHNLRWRPFEG